MRFVFYLIHIMLYVLLAGCVYHERIEQGNVLTPQKTQQIKRGMPESQVIAILGTPVLKKMYRDNQLVYVYTDQPKRSHFIRDRFIVILSNGRVVDIQTDEPKIPSL